MVARIEGIQLKSCVWLFWLSTMNSHPRPESKSIATGVLPDVKDSSGVLDGGFMRVRKGRDISAQSRAGDSSRRRVNLLPAETTEATKEKDVSVREVAQ